MTRTTTTRRTGPRPDHDSAANRETVAEILVLFPDETTDAPEEWTDAEAMPLMVA